MPRCQAGGAAARWAHGRYLLHHHNELNECDAAVEPSERENGNERKYGRT